MTVIGTGTPSEGNRWSLVTCVRDDDPVLWLEVAGRDFGIGQLWPVDWA